MQQYPEKNILYCPRKIKMLQYKWRINSKQYLMLLDK